MDRPSRRSTPRSETPAAARQEIERKYLVRRLPDDLRTCPGHEIVQGYLAVTEAGENVRIRRKDDICTLTSKRGAGLVRDEVEITITRSQFDVLWPATEGRRVEKVRYERPYAGHLIELDVYGGSLQGLVLAEVEFRSVEESARFAAPGWFGPEVTEDARYRNSSLALYGLPDNPPPARHLSAP